jgi:hypothetical protein
MPHHETPASKQEFVAPKMEEKDDAFISHLKIKSESPQ